jgi:hypothetical protein
MRAAKVSGIRSWTVAWLFSLSLSLSTSSPWNSQLTRKPAQRQRSRYQEHSFKNAWHHTPHKSSQNIWDQWETAARGQRRRRRRPQKLVHLPFSTIYFDLGPRLKDSFLKDGIRIRIWSCLKNAQRQRSTKNTKGFFLPILELGLNLFYLLQISNVFLLCPALDVFPGNWR